MRLNISSNFGRLVLLFTALGLLQFWYRFLDFLARGRPVDWFVPFLEELTGIYTALVLVISLITPVVLRVRPDRVSWTRWLPIHVLVLLVYSLLHTSLIWGSRLLLFPLFGRRAYDYGAMPIRYAMEFPSDVMGYVIVTTVVVLLERLREANMREVQLAHLQAELARAQLESLTLQLQPHFLFNSLNAVAATIHEDPRKADLMLARLAEYLRRTLKTSSKQEIPLSEELDMLELYVSVMKARFEDALHLDITLEDGVKDALVPQLILQPIVENAIQHGFDPLSSRVRVAVSVAHAGDSLTLSVRDHGSGLDVPLKQRVGLTNTQSRLERLHGEKAHFEIANAKGGGTEVTIRLPWQIVGHAA